MNEQKKEIITKIKNELTGQKALDLPIIDDYIKQFTTDIALLSPSQQKLNMLIVGELSRLRLSYFSKEEIMEKAKERHAIITSKKQEFSQAIELTRQKKYNLALPMILELLDDYQNINVRLYNFPNDIEYFLYLESPFNEVKYQLKRTIEPVCLYHYYVGICKIGLGKIEEAILSFKEALEYNPRAVACMIELAGIYLKKNEFELAYERLMQAIEFAYTRGQLAIIYHLFGQYFYNNVKYELANACYLVSLHYDDNLKMNYLAIKQIEDTIGEAYQFASSKDYQEIFEKYNLQFGPSKYLIDVINKFTKYSLDHKKLKTAKYLLTLAYDLTKSKIYEEELKRFTNL